MPHRNPALWPWAVALAGAMALLACLPWWLSTRAAAVGAAGAALAAVRRRWPGNAHVEALGREARAAVARREASRTQVAKARTEAEDTRRADLEARLRERAG